MAVFNGTIRSAVLEMDTQLSVILPYDRPGEGQKSPCRVLYLLHGMGENHTAWTRYTGIERYARRYGVAVIMPEVQRSFYYDMAMGMHYYTYITQELPVLCGQLFHISGRREDTFIAGLSMGGYGAMKCAFHHPEQYAACASFSGLCDISYVMRHYDNPEAMRPAFAALFGDNLQVQPRDDLFRQAEALMEISASRRPGIFLTCGIQDFLHEQNLALRDHLRSLGLSHEFHEWEGAHEWGFWDKSVQMALEFFFAE